MKNYPNIETRKTYGYYLAYSADGRSWRVSGKSGHWTATASVTSVGKINILIGFERLSEISEELKSIK